MPHVVVEYTDNLGEAARIPELLAAVADRFVRSDGLFPAGGVRVRAVRLSDYVVADGKGDDAFVHITAKIARGRPEAAKAQFFGALFELVKAHFADLFETRGLALSMYVEEADEAGSYKHNNLHARVAARSRS